MIRMIAEYLPPFAFWLSCFGTVSLFFLLATFATNKGWRRPVISASAISVTALILFSIALSLLQPPELGGLRSLPSFVRGTAVELAGAIVFVGPAAAVFSKLRRTPMLIRAVGVGLAALIAIPVGFVVLLLVACVVGAGCV